MVVTDVEAGDVAALLHGVEHMGVDRSAGTALLVDSGEFNVGVVAVFIDIYKFRQAYICLLYTSTVMLLFWAVMLAPFLKVTPLTVVSELK